MDGSVVKEIASRITDSSPEKKYAQAADVSSPAGAEQSSSMRKEGSVTIETHEHNYTRDQGSAQLVCNHVHGDGRVCGYTMTIGLHVMSTFGTYAYEDSNHD